MSKRQLTLIRRLDKDRKLHERKWASHLENKFQAYGLRAAVVFRALCNQHRLKAENEFDWTELTGPTLNGLGSLDLDYRPQYLGIARSTYDIINSTMGLGVNLTAEEEYKIIALGGKRMGLIDLPQQTRDAIMQAISEGRANGEGAADIAKRIQDSVEAGPWGSARTRSMVIARTETKYAQNAASLDCYDQAENVTGVMIFDGRLDTSDEECMARDGDIVDIEEAQAMADSEHPNGTLSFAPVVENAYDSATAGAGGD